MLLHEEEEDADEEESVKIIPHVHFNFLHAVTFYMFSTMSLEDKLRLKLKVNVLL